MTLSTLLDSIRTHSVFDFLQRQLQEWESFI